MHLLKGNFLYDGAQPSKPNKTLATVVEYEGEAGKCWLKLVEVEDLDFKVDWYPASLRGYQQAAKIPPEHRIDMAGAVERWNWRIPENGSVHFCKTREERDANLVGE